MSGMTLGAARAAIEAILAALPNVELPEFDEVEVRDGEPPIVWFGGTGRHLGSAKRGGEHDPTIYRREASGDAVLLEAVYRLDQRYMDSDYDVTALGIEVAS